jgi:type I restriction enzyme M protein
MYGDFTEGERVKILPNESFGYQRITVERPLRRRYEVTAETLPAIETASGWTKLTEPERLALVQLLERLAAFSSTDRTAVAVKLGPLPKAIEKAVWEAISVSDPAAPVVSDRKGHPEPNPDLRDNESVPLPGPTSGFEPDPTERLATAPYRSSVTSYMAAEILPYVPDAWVDYSKTKVGYEIPLARFFYRYAEVRSIEEIDSEIREANEQIRRLLEELVL